MRNGLVLSASILLAACQTVSPPDPLPPPLEATVAWRSIALGGAAERVPGYVHVLRRGGTAFRAPDTNEAALMDLSAPPAVAAPAAPGSRDAGLAPATLSAIGAIQKTPRPSIGMGAITRDSFAPPPTAIAAATANKAPAAIPGSEQDTLRLAWKKYCNGALGMTDAQWQLVRDAGAPDNVPAEFAAHCVHPK